MRQVFHCLLLLSVVPGCAEEGDVRSIATALSGATRTEPGAWANVLWLDAGCTAVLIHPQVIVTAAHCGEDHERAWQGDNLHVIVDHLEGTVSLPDSQDATEVAIERCQTHPDFGLRNDSDVAYCVLKDPLAVPIFPIASFDLQDDVTATLVGYGLTDPNDARAGIKREVDVALELSVDGELWAGHQDAGSCGGDSGGPAFIRVSDVWYLLGILSDGPPNSCGSGHYIRLSAHVPWIEEASGIDITSSDVDNVRTDSSNSSCTLRRASTPTGTPWLSMALVCTICLQRTRRRKLQWRKSSEVKR